MRPGEPAVDLRGERERMLDGPLSLDAEQRHAIRDEIISSWRRCKLIGVAPCSEDVPYRPDFERPNRLLRAAGPVIDRLADQLEGGPVSILLADSEAQIIDRRAGGRELAKALDKALVSPGFFYSEEFTGTTGSAARWRSANRSWCPGPSTSGRTCRSSPASARRCGTRSAARWRACST